MKIKIYGTTDVGRVRKANQDNFYFNEDHRIAIVADGIGGRKGGEVASAIAVKGLAQEFVKSPVLKHGEVAPFLLATIDKINRQIIETGEADSDITGMGTTLNALVFVGDLLYLAHIGDSRTYLYYKGGLWQLTLDHNMEVYVERGWLPRETLDKSAKPTALVRALGLSTNCEVDIYEKSLKPGEIFLTCSDGLSGMVTDKKMRSLIHEYENKLKDLPKRLIEEANANGGRDNVTVIISEVMRI